MSPGPGATSLVDLPAPRALLLDFGGVIVESTPRPEGIDEVALEVEGLLRTRELAGTDDVSAAGVAADLRAGVATWERWKRARSRERAPRDISHQEFWARFVAHAWAEPARRVVMDAAAQLCRSLSMRSSVRRPRPGIVRLIERTHAVGVPIGIVSNALSGAVHREMLEDLGLMPYIDIQVYSDELGIRKPNPEAILTAVRALGHATRDTWYVGDQHDRDVLCGRRAGVGTVVLMATDRHPQPPRRRQRPDLEVDDPAALADILASLLGRPVEAGRVVQ